MKRVLSLMLVLLLACAVASAEGVRRVESGDVIELPEGDAVVTFETKIDQDMNDVDTFTLTVGDAVASNETYGLTGDLFTAMLGEDTLLFVPAVGFSDWEETFVYVCENGALTLVADLNARPENMSIDENVLSTTIRAATVCTWSRPADYILAKDLTGGFADVAALPSKLVEMPRYAYPMGMIVTAKVALPLYTSPAFAEIGGQIEAGEQMILSCGNDRDWVYVVGTVPGDEYEVASGYLKLDDAMMIDVNGAKAASYDILDGLFMAG